MPIPSHRARVIKALEDAGFRNRETRLPTKASGGTFSVSGGTSVLVSAEWWGATGDDVRGLLVRMAWALREAGFEVEDRGTKVYVPWVTARPAPPA